MRVRVIRDKDIIDKTTHNGLYRLKEETIPLNQQQGGLL